MEAGGGGAVVIAMVMHPSNTTLQEKALRAIRNLSAQREEHKMVLANIGGIDAVVSAIQVHRDVAGGQEAGAWALSNMAGNGDIDRRLRWNRRYHSGHVGPLRRRQHSRMVLSSAIHFFPR
jgi:hypothetical protein